MLNLIGYWFPMALQPAKPRDPGVRANPFLKYRFRYLSNTYDRRHRDWYRKVYLQSYHWRQVVRPAALKRDGYKCQHPGCRERGKHLDVHHKVYWYLGRETERPEWFSRSVTTLCRKHHHLEHHPEDRWSWWRIKAA